MSAPALYESQAFMVHVHFSCLLHRKWGHDEEPTELWKTDVKLVCLVLLVPFIYLFIYLFIIVLFY